MMIMMWRMMVMVIRMDIGIMVGKRFRMVMMMVGLDDIRGRSYLPRGMTIIGPCSCLSCQSLWGQRGPITHLKMIRKIG